MGRLLLSASALGILGIGAGAALGLIASAPAFNADLRRANVFDQDILQLGSDMYDLPDYLMQQAVSFQRADLIAFSGPDDSQAAASVEVVADRGKAGAALMAESLALDPGNAPGWAVMAWAQLYAGDLDAAQTALRHSWTLAPYNRALAQERIDLALVLFDPFLSDMPEPLADADRAGMLRDFEVLRRHGQPGVFQLYVDGLAEVGLDLALPDTGTNTGTDTGTDG